MAEPAEAAAATEDADPDAAKLQELLAELRRAMQLLHRSNEVTHLDILCRTMASKQMPLSARLFVLQHGGLSLHDVVHKGEAIFEAALDARQLSFQVRCIQDFVKCCKEASQDDTYDYPNVTPPDSLPSKESALISSSGSAFVPHQPPLSPSSEGVASSGSAFSAYSTGRQVTVNSGTTNSQLPVANINGPRRPSVISQSAGDVYEKAPAQASRLGHRPSEPGVRPVELQAPARKAKSQGGPSGGKKVLQMFLFPEKHQKRQQTHGSTS